MKLFRPTLPARLLGIALLATVAGETASANLFDVEALRGVAVAVRQTTCSLQLSDASRELHYLGGGIAGGKVFRAVSKIEPGQVSIEKHYDTAKSFANDVEAMDILERGLNATQIQARSLRVQKRLDTSRSPILHLEDIRGVTLRDLYQRYRDVPEMRAAFETYFEGMLKDFEAGLRKYVELYGAAENLKLVYLKREKSPITLDGLRATFRIDEPDGRIRFVEFYLKDDNLLVEPTGGLVVIDPY